MNLQVASTAPEMRAATRWRRAVLAILSVGWALAMRRFGSGDIYWAVGVYALATMTVVLALPHGVRRSALWPTGTHVALGLIVGVLMTASTYPAFRLTAWAFPELAPRVASLYLAAWTETPLTALAWTTVILTGEEVLWRGAWIDAWQPHLGPIAAGAVSVIGFGLMQWGSGSAIVALVAAVCGAVWTITRLQTGSIVPGLIAHAIWTPTVVFFLPVIT
jgi:membrane protease YdiL (CAAX protease family)